MAAIKRVALDFAACLFLSRYQLANRTVKPCMRPCQGKIEMSWPVSVCAGIIPVRRMSLDSPTGKHFFGAKIVEDEVAVRRRERAISFGAETGVLINKTSKR